MLQKKWLERVAGEARDGEGVRAAFYQSAFAWKDTNKSCDFDEFIECCSRQTHMILRNYENGTGNGVKLAFLT